MKNVNVPVKSHLKRKITPPKIEPLNKSIKISDEPKEANAKLSAMKKADLVRFCEEILLQNENLLEEKKNFIEMQKEHQKTIENLEEIVKGLRLKCSDKSVYLCGECDYLA